MKHPGLHEKMAPTRTMRCRIKHIFIGLIKKPGWMDARERATKTLKAKQVNAKLSECSYGIH